MTESAFVYVLESVIRIVICPCSDLDFDFGFGLDFDLGLHCGSGFRFCLRLNLKNTTEPTRFRCNLHRFPYCDYGDFDTSCHGGECPYDCGFGSDVCSSFYYDRGGDRDRDFAYDYDYDYDYGSGSGFD